MTVWCQRCNRPYGTINALDQHVRDSPKHHDCPECDFDADTWDELLDHCRDEGCRTVCQDCDDGDGIHYDPQSDEYWNHVEEFNVCIQCERHFDSPTNLHQHQLSHRTPTYKCYECTSMFKTYGGMVIHLEHGTCGDIDSTDLNKLAAVCNRWDQFIDTNYRGELFNQGHTTYSATPFMCPTCDAAMSKLSSLFQHIESDSCAQKLNEGAIGQLRRFLRSRLS
ncbi:hypothetical protein BKA58DRAFT_437990 [Alternaria rosae]|uniref:uncharacterized protein n=1 Tax=Alternaria rosae TaxID=1187941 RepID=UPI001E8DC802|nr:uncharacterized protein BKA58DRAFT_437990 [Alternaria rosae]KAH6876037.1 hypothetical protein BKA58DRAFT_437990 [Alternaria rosae]